MTWFGLRLELLGHWALKHYRLVGVVVAVLTFAAALMLPSITFDGNTDNLLQSNRRSYVEYQEFLSQFPTVASSVVLHITDQNAPLISKAGIEKLNQLQIDVSFLDQVEQVTSALSLRWFSSRDGAYVPVLPPNIRDDAAVTQAIEDATRHLPELTTLLSVEADAALFVIVLSDGSSIADHELDRFMDDLDTVIEDSGLRARRGGLGAVRHDVVSALKSDQFRVTALGTLLGVGIAFALFGNWTAVVLSNIPAMVSVIWTLGVMVAMRQPLDPLTTILPVFASILTFADGLHLVSNVRRRIVGGEKADNALEIALAEVGPATALTSITTAVAFASLVLAGAPLVDLAIFGVIAVSLSFLSVIIVLPVLGRFLAAGLERSSARGLALGRWIMPVVNRTAFERPLFVAVAAGACVAVLLLGRGIHSPNIDLSDYLSKSSEAYQAEAAIAQDFGGAERLYVSLPLPAGARFDHPDARRAIHKAHTAIETLMGEGRVTSLAGAWRGIGADDQLPDDIALEIERSSGFVSDDRQHVLLVATVEGLRPAQETVDLHSKLSQLPALADATITGPSVMNAFEASHVIGQLKFGLVLAAVLAAGLVGVVCRSGRIFAAVLLANVLVVLLIEVSAFAVDRPADFALYVALTIAIGVGIDDAVHLINLYLRQPESRPRTQALRLSINHAAPALMGATIVLCTNLMVTQFSALPVVSFIGLTVAAALAAALISNIVVLPAVLLVGNNEGDQPIPEKNLGL